MPKRSVLIATGVLAAAIAVPATAVAVASASTAPAVPATVTTAAPATVTTAPAEAQAGTVAAAGNDSSTQRTFPFTPSWLPYGLSLSRSHVDVEPAVLDVYASATSDGAGVQITVAGADALTSIDRWEHLSTTATTVDGLPATLARSTGDRAGSEYLLFQRTAGSYVLVRAGQGNRTPADAKTVESIATGITATPLTGHAPTAP